MPEHSTYEQFMGDAGGKLILTVETGEPIEVRDFGVMLKSIADQYDLFAMSAYGVEETDARFYIHEIRRGSIIVEFAAVAIGMMENVIILKQFLELTTQHVRAFTTGQKISAEASAKGSMIVDMVRAVANSEDGSMALAYKETPNAKGTEIALVVTKNQAVDIIKNVFSDQADPVSASRALPFEGPTLRALMRLYQHNQDPNVSAKKNTQHKAIVTDLSPKPINLSYASEEIADELQDILSGVPYADVILDVSIQPMRLDGKVKSYRLLQIHSWFRDEKEQLL